MNIQNILEFERAKDTQGYHFLIEGDSGGWIYVCCPSSMLKLGWPEALLLMHDLEAIEATGQLSGLDLDDQLSVGGYDAWLSYGKFESGSRYQGADIQDDLWVSEDILRRSPGYLTQIRSVLEGTQQRLHAAGL